MRTLILCLVLTGLLFSRQTATAETQESQLGLMQFPLPAEDLPHPQQEYETAAERASARGGVKLNSALPRPVTSSISVGSLLRERVAIDKANDAFRNPAGPRPTLVKPVVYVAGLQILGLSALLVTSREVTGFEPPNARNLIRAYTTTPVWDKDGVLFNYLAHPLWGSESYLRARSARFSPLQSFIFSSASSVAWEYVFESWAEQPSVQDLLFTSTIGSVLGELRYRARRELQTNNAWWARALLMAVDPLNTILH